MTRPRRPPRADHPPPGSRPPRARARTAAGHGGRRDRPPRAARARSRRSRSGFGSNQTRTHNRQNQIASGPESYTHDANGNITGKNPLARPGGQSFGYDAWNRLASHTLNGTTSSFDETTQYRYDALGRRVSETTTIGGGGGGIGITDGTLELYYSDRWQVIHERRQIEGGGGTGASGEGPGPEGFGFGTYEQQTDYVWSLRYVDALVARNHDADLSDFNGLEQRLYVQQDANFNVTAITDDDGDVLERFIYDPYGWATYLDPNWTVDAGGSDYGWVYLHQGGRWQAESDVYHFRHRDYDPMLGRWVQQDPIGYGDGANRYQAMRSNPPVITDALGLMGLATQPATQPTTRPAVEPEKQKYKDVDGDGDLDIVVEGGKWAGTGFTKCWIKNNIHVFTGEGKDRVWVHHCPFPNGKNYFYPDKDGSYRGVVTNPNPRFDHRGSVEYIYKDGTLTMIERDHDGNVINEEQLGPTDLGPTR